MDKKFEKLLEDVSYMRGKMDATFDSLEKTNKGVSELLKNHDTRIVALENEQGKITTKVGIIGAVLGAGGSILGKFILNLFMNK